MLLMFNLNAKKNAAKISQPEILLEEKLNHPKSQEQESQISTSPPPPPQKKKSFTSTFYF